MLRQLFEFATISKLKKSNVRKYSNSFNSNMLTVKTVPSTLYTVRDIHKKETLNFSFIKPNFKVSCRLDRR